MDTGEEPHTALCTLDDLIGNLDHIDCKAGTFELRGLKIAYWHYVHPTKATKPPVVALHGGPGFPHGELVNSDFGSQLSRLYSASQTPC